MSIVDLKFKFPNLGNVIREHRQEIDRFIAAQMQFNRGMLFDQEGAYNGHQKWDELKLRKGQILTKRGTLRKSIAPRSSNGQAGPGGIVKFSGGIITIGSNLIYSSMMNWGTTKLPGGVLVPKNAKALMIPIPGGKSATEGAKTLGKSGKKIKRDVGGKQKSTNVIFRQSVKIPARRYDEWNDKDQEELTIALRNKLVQVLNK